MKARVYVLGPLEISIGGTPSRLPQLAAARDLIRILVLEPRQHAADELRARIWSDEFEHDRKASLDTAVGHARKVFAELHDREVIRRTSATSLDGGQLWVDAAAVESDAALVDGLVGAEPWVALSLHRGRVGVNATGDWLVPHQKKQVAQIRSLLRRTQLEADWSPEDVLAVGGRSFVRSRIAEGHGQLTRIAAQAKGFVDELLELRVVDAASYRQRSDSERAQIVDRWLEVRLALSKTLTQFEHDLDVVTALVEVQGQQTRATEALYQAQVVCRTELGRISPSSLLSPFGKVTTPDWARVDRALRIADNGYVEGRFACVYDLAT